MRLTHDAMDEWETSLRSTTGVGCLASGRAAERIADAPECHLSTNEPAPSCIVKKYIRTIIWRCAKPHHHSATARGGNVMRVIHCKISTGKVELSVRNASP
jgi:hypothetical protein